MITASSWPKVGSYETQLGMVEARMWLWPSSCCRPSPLSVVDVYKRQAYQGTRVLLTGHTGFKGSWLAAWLAQLGAQVTGLSLAQLDEPNHWTQLGDCAVDWRGDIRHPGTVADAIAQARPEIVFHLAAQTLVRQSYGAPLDSWSTNVMGTANVLEACRRTPGAVSYTHLDVYKRQPLG